MHELATCTVEIDGVAVLHGYVRTYEDGVLWVGSEGIVRGIAPEAVAALRVLDEVRGECDYVGTVARVTADTVAFAGVELLSTVQKRAVARVSVTVECEGFARVPWTAEDGAEHERQAHTLADAAAGPPDEAEEDGLPAGAVVSDDGEPIVVAPVPATSHADEIPLRFTVLDVSAHGMRMMSQTALPSGSTVRFVFPELSDAFWLQAVVVRAQPSRTGTHYGCRFVETSPRETDELFRYVLRTQGAQRRQQMLA